MALPFAATSAALARTYLIAWLSALGVPDEVQEDGRLVVSELVGNAVRHAAPLSDGTMLVAWNRGPEGLEIAVTDGGASTRPQARRAPVSALGGRGLSIVETLASRWWTETSTSQCSVHAVLAG